MILISLFLQIIFVHEIFQASDPCELDATGPSDFFSLHLDGWLGLFGGCLTSPEKLT